MYLMYTVSRYIVLCKLFNTRRSAASKPHFLLPAAASPPAGESMRKFGEARISTIIFHFQLCASARASFYIAPVRPRAPGNSCDLYKFSRMPRLCEMIDSLHANIDRYLRIYHQFMMPKGEPEEAHKQIMKALKEGDTEQAIVLLEIHLRNADLKISQFLVK